MKDGEKMPEEPMDAKQVQQKPLAIIDVSGYHHLLIRCESHDRVYDITFLRGKLQEVIHTEMIKV